MSANTNGVGRPFGGWSLSLGLALALVLTVTSCAKEDKNVQIANQEASIDTYITGLGEGYEVVRNGGSNRVVVTPGSGDVLEMGDSLWFWYSAHIFTGSGKGSIFATNRSDDAESFGIEPQPALGPWKIRYGSEPMVSGLMNGLEGMKSGERCYIIFSAKYGFYDSEVGVVPALSPLFYDIEVVRIVNNGD